MAKIVRRVVIGVGVLVGLAVCAVGALVGLYLYTTRPVVDGAQLGSGTITAAVTGHYGPIARLAYVFALRDGGVGLVDTGDDRAAVNIDAALAQAGKDRAAVRAILITHSHADHAGALLSFPDAIVYGVAPDIDSLRRRRSANGAVGETKTATDGERLDVFGTPVEVFALPGHTQGSAAYLVDGVLFLGDAAHGMRDGTFGVNEMFSEDASANVRSLIAMIDRLQPRRGDVRQVAFGHAGPLDGLDALLAWRSSR